MDWEKIFANYATNKDVTSKIYKQLLNLKKKKKKHPIKRWAGEQNRHFPKEEMSHRWPIGT